MSFRVHLLSAIHDYLTATPDIVEIISDRHYTGVAPRGTICPYVIFNQISSVPQWTSGLAYNETVMVQVDVYGITDIQTLETAGEINEVLGDAPLAVSSGLIQVVERIGGGSLSHNEVSENGERLWRYQLDYKIWTSRSKNPITSQEVNILSVNGIV
ncbi:MAG: hypothetical protein JWN86_1775 [Planctomycetota bacterium]|nr:hypothetical protein [Planctomycetota bacterium]